MKKSFSQLFILAGLILLVSSCSHDTDFFDGPNLVDRFGDFNVLENIDVSSPTVDFAAGETVFFTARYNKNINWIVEIVGSESGAVKRIEGFSDVLDQSNARWDGGTTDLPFFKDEMCTATLIIPEEPTFTGTVDVEVLSGKIYAGSVFTDFETDAGSDIFVGNFEFELTPRTGRQNDIPAAQGDFYWLFEGTDNVVANFFVGLINIGAGVTGNTYVPLPTTVPEELYFNAFIYADGGPHGIAVIQFVFDSNDSGEFEDGVDQTFQLPGDFPLNWEGWQQISHSMADVGMTQEQLQKLVAIRVLLISDMNSQPSPPLQVDFGIDYMTFTAGAPLDIN